MNLEQAFNLIVQVTGEFKGNRQDHAMITQALELLREEVVDKTSPLNRGTDSPIETITEE